jgi:hypothetical protein
MPSHTNKSISTQNEAFWNELCGTNLAKTLGIKDHSINSIKCFDKDYFDFYPYLLKHADPQRMKERKVLEVGLGYGSLERKLA